MAAKMTAINEIVKECKVLLLDVEGTTTSVSFVKDKLYKYTEDNVSKYLEDEWESDVVKRAVSALRALTIKEEDRSDAYTGELPGDVPAEDSPKADQIVAIVQRVKWQMHGPKNLQNEAVNVLLWHVWKNGYDAGDLKGHVFEDVLPAMEQWRSVDGQKVYIYSSGSVEAQKMLFGKSEAGDLLCHIDGHFDTVVGTKQESGSYTAIAEKIECKPNEIFFLTDIYQEAEAANKAGLHAALMVREGNAPLPCEATDKFPQLTSMLQVIATQKRKLPDQEEEPAPPAKVAKIEEASIAEAKVPEDKAAVETMEVDTTPVCEKKPEEQNENKGDTPVQAEAAVADANDANLPVVDAKSVVEEKPEKMDDDDVASPVADSSNKDEEQVITPKENINVVTEKEEASEKLPNAEIAEKSEMNTVETIDPVVEEMDSESEAAKLQNVGDVLEKECDDLLSKVNEVTNLEKIKPLLPTVSEELSGDNGDTSDIVESILDSELEIEMKQAEAEAEAKIEKEKKEDALVDSTDNIETDKEQNKTDVVREKPEDETNVPDVTLVEAATEIDDKDEETKSATEIDIEKNDEPQLNGKSNGTIEVAALNGDSNKEDELKARLGVENSTGVTNGSEATNAINGSEVADATNGSEVADATNCSEVAEATNGSEVAEATNGSEVAEVTNGSKMADATNGSEVADATNGSEVADATNSSEVADATNGSEVADATNGSEVADATNDSKVADATNGSEVADATSASEVTDATNGSKVADTTNGSEVTDNGDGKNGKAETEVAEIKVKTVVAEDAEPIEKAEHPTET